MFFSFFGSRRYFYWFNLVALGFIPFPKEMLALMHNAGMGGVTPKRCCDRIEVDRIFVTPLVITQILNLLIETFAFHIMENLKIKRQELAKSQRVREMKQARQQLKNKINSMQKNAHGFAEHLGDAVGGVVEGGQAHLRSFRGRVRSVVFGDDHKANKSRMTAMLRAKADKARLMLRGQSAEAAASS